MYARIAKAKRAAREADAAAIASGTKTRQRVEVENRIIDGSKIRVDYANVPGPRAGK